MFDLISIGNISIDLYFKGSSLTFEKDRFQLAIGGKYFVDQFHTGIGGGGVNVAIGVAKEGIKSAVMGTIGNNPFKKMILQLLEAKQVSSKLCFIENDYYNISSILLSEKGERSIIHYSTPHKNILRKASSINNLIEAKVVYMGNLPDVSLTEREVTLNLCKKNNIITVVNLGVKDCRRSKVQVKHFLSKIDVLIVNGHEFAELVKAQYKDIHFHENVVRWYFRDLEDKTVIITEGKNGSYGYMGGKVYHQKAVEVDKIIDATGAGDGYTAGFISEFFRSRNIEKSMEKGSRYAAKILSIIGAN
ncbi:hypothetical protein A2954_00410 [Candidatus Roizmanbacteria bacterium RIFCSPLOWO2_01_FULL_37_12]|uniref:Carbohydrate kinase PfkB domain-containing protein n=1 Tax=Candidatus Roizmanbacteria bacterium RIFCSPLOWO2_01_FULL_37_12 TaxID=1802056 RepID=A0A1F7IB82_9BACT|nr:MAG: hypothetical protein A2768_00375 [Candidatus Roizmanbacteria bacterium RIFCSPHIGHO2_01_FULL_37_16]OGK25473.1 MAG: hypothetical protein A3D76_06860 [Candidatus Roizmanbacteria bacterium RIFCSPHIGHO2_02_FULL_37_9b]OGK40622.1 MAG: hypothetical protein A2954_00410 [Candidatus Roizmanbacteria bacterium RIFCSPLOWO2_01_FULL_37_12]